LFIALLNEALLRWNSLQYKKKKIRNTALIHVQLMPNTAAMKLSPRSFALPVGDGYARLQLCVHLSKLSRPATNSTPRSKSNVFLQVRGNGQVDQGKGGDLNPAYHPSYLPSLRQLGRPLPVEGAGSATQSQTVRWKQQQQGLLLRSALATDPGLGNT